MRIVGNPPSGGKKPTTPTIGTATDGGTGTTVSVAFTPSTYIGKGTITYTATSSPGSLTNTGSGSPIVVSGLTTGTAYTFTVQGATNYGVNSDSSAASNSVTPASPSSFESIATATGTGSSGTISFTSIPSTYKHLQIRLWNNNGNGIRLRFNSNTSAIYGYHRLRGNGTAASANASTSDTSIVNISETTSSANIGGVAIIDIIDYASTTKNKVTRTFTGYDENGSGAIDLHSGLWISTSAINAIEIYATSGNFTTSSTFALYGIKG